MNPLNHVFSKLMRLLDNLIMQPRVVQYLGHMSLLNILFVCAFLSFHSLVYFFASSI